MSNKSFVHTHVHTSYSLLDGASKIPELVAAAKADGQPAVSATDHGNLYGVIELYKECKKQGDIKAILGTEVYFVNDRLERTSLKRDSHTDDFKARYHMTILAENNTGWQNLMKLSSDSFLKGYYAKPRSDWESLSQFSEGLIATTGCLGGIVLQHLLHGDTEGALAAAARQQDIFGKDNLFIELQDHGIPAQAKTNPMLLDIAKKLNAPLLSSNDSHYTYAKDSHAHASLLCCQTQTTLSDPNRFKFESDQHYLKTAAEMRYLFREVEDACDNTLWVAERCNVDIDFDTLHLPEFETPEGFDTPTQFLTHLCFKAVPERYGEVTDEIAERLAYELSVIDSLGMSSYMLIVWDLMEYAKKRSIRRGPGRGSSSGSIIAFLLHITDIDPLKHDLMFERFVNPHRIEMTDIDLDFDTRYRDEMINYTKDKYGEDYCAQIITFSMIKARSAVRDAARVLGHPPEVGDKLSKAMPPLISGVDIPLYACMEKDPKFEEGYGAAKDLRQLYESNATAKEVVDVALGLEGLVRSTSHHAAAVVIGDRPLSELVPLQRKGPDEPIITQWEKKTIESLGLLKMDFLGLRNLDVITDTLNLIGKPGFDVTDFSMDDPKTFKMLREGRTRGCFQIEGQGITKLVQRMRPSNIDDLAALVALYRPGPIGSNMHNDYCDRKHGVQPSQAFHPDAEEILGPTYSLMIFQEQLLQIAVKFAGYTLPEADGLRKIVGRKLVDAMTEERIKFVEGCVNTGYTKQLGTQIFDMIEKFGLYGFGKGHSYSYAYISYQTAFLKANYPKEYMAALCGSVVDDIERCAIFLHEAREMGIPVLTPDINKSETFFSVVDEGIIVGLAAIKGFGVEKAHELIAERDKNGLFTSIINFVERVNPTSTVLNGLAWAGALDQFGSRLGIVSTSDNILAKYRKGKKKGLYQAEEISLFDTEQYWDVEIPTQEYSDTEKFAHEKSVLGLYISGHPLQEYSEHQTDTLVVDLHTTEETFCDLLVTLSEVQVKRTRAGQQMAVLIAEDATGAVEVPVFPSMYAKLQGMFNTGDIGVLTVKVGTNRDGERNYIYHKWNKIPRKDISQQSGSFLNLYLPRGFAQDDKMVSKLKGLLLSHHGNDEVGLYVGKQSKVKLPHTFTVKKSPSLISEVNVLFQEFISSKTKK